MTLTERQEAVRKIHNRLMLILIGKPAQAAQCSCGLVHNQDGVVVDVRPPSNEHDSLRADWLFWRVEVQEDCGGRWSCGLTEFLEEAFLDQLFRSFFGPAWTRQLDDDPYQLAVRHQARIDANFPPAVFMLIKPGLLELSIYWGDQHMAATLHSFFELQGSAISAASTGVFSRVIGMLEQLNPEVYRGGPVPQFPWDTADWLSDYQAALQMLEARARAVSYHLGSYSLRQGSFAAYYVSKLIFILNEGEEPR